MLGMTKDGILSAPSGNRSVESWQDETNADKFGNTSQIAEVLEKTGFEDISFAPKHNFGDTYYETFFLDVDDARFRVENGKSPYQISFNLDELVLSSGNGK